MALVLAALALLGLGAALGAPAYARYRLEKLLGPQAHVDAVTFGLHEAHVRGVHVGKLDGDWPTEAQLHVEELRVAYSLAALWDGPRAIEAAEVTGLYLAIHRTADGSTRVLPGAFSSDSNNDAKDQDADDGDATAAWLVQTIRVRDAEIELVDDAPKRRARIRVQELGGHIDDVQLPRFDRPFEVDLEGTLPGRNAQGALHVHGPIDIAEANSELKLRIAHADLLPLEPYVVKTMGLKLKRGTYDFDLTAHVDAGELRAPGRLVVHDLELGSTVKKGESFMRLSREAMVESLGGFDGDIDSDFTVHGSLSDPQFSVAKQLMAEMTVAFVATLGVSVIGVASGLSELGLSSVDRLGDLLSPDESGG